MTAARAYRRPVSTEEARAELVRCAGTQFDPTVVRAFLEVSIPRLRLILGVFGAVVSLTHLRWLLTRWWVRVGRAVSVATVTVVARRGRSGSSGRPVGHRGAGVRRTGRCWS